MYRIAKRGKFSAAHTLPDHPKCSRMHGHNYVFEVSLQSRTLNKDGMIIDFGKLKEFIRVIENKYDHRYLNDLLETVPTAEVLAAEICLEFAEFIQTLYPDVAKTVTRYGCKVWETDDSVAEYFLVTIDGGPKRK